MEKPLPKTALRAGQIVYLVESCRTVREAVVRGQTGGLYTIRFTDVRGGIRVRPDRLFPTREAAQAHLRQKKAERQPPQPLSYLWHNVPVWEC